MAHDTIVPLASRPRFNGRQFSDRLRLALSDTLKKRDGSMLSRADIAGVDEKTVQRWLSGKHLQMRPQQLITVGARTGYSIDWLLGFDDVPQMRKGRASIGPLSDAVLELLGRRVPSGAPGAGLSAKELLDPQLAETIVDGWYRFQLMMFTQDVAPALHDLASAAESAARHIGSNDAIREAGYVASYCRVSAAKLASPNSTWADTEWFRFPHPARQMTADIATSFKVPGSIAFLWRGPKRDVAVFLCEQDKSPRYRVETKSRATRFLLPIPGNATATERLPRRAAAAKRK